MTSIDKNTLITISEIESPYNAMLQVSNGKAKIYAGVDGLTASTVDDLEVLIPQFSGIKQMSSVPKYLYFKTEDADTEIYLQGVIIA